MRVIRKLDGEDSILRRTLVNDLAFETKKDEKYVVRYITELHKSGLLTITRGNHFSSRVSIGG
jgi:hypothetical protein